MKDEKNQVAERVEEIGVNQIDFHDPRLFRDLLGQHDQHVKILQNTLQVKIRPDSCSMVVSAAVEPLTKRVAVPVRMRATRICSLNLAVMLMMSQKPVVDSLIVLVWTVITLKVDPHLLKAPALAAGTLITTVR